MLLGNTKVLLANTKVLLANTKVLLGNTKLDAGSKKILLLQRVSWAVCKAPRSFACLMGLPTPLASNQGRSLQHFLNNMLNVRMGIWDT